MLGIKVGDEWLDLFPGTLLEIEQNNPYLQFDDKVLGDYSLPLELPDTPKNRRLTGYASLIQTRVDTVGIDVAVFHSGFQHSIGKLKVEKPNIHLNTAKKGRLSCYYLTGISAFYQDTKDIRLNQVDLGGERSFAWAGFVYFGNSFWSHIHQVLNAAPGSFDYAFYPVINKTFDGGLGSVDLVNRVRYNAGAGRVEFEEFCDPAALHSEKNPIVPFPYLKYVLEKAIEHVGWKIQGDILSAPNFQQITLANFRSLDWSWSKKYGFTVLPSYE